MADVGRQGHAPVLDALRIPTDQVRAGDEVERIERKVRWALDLAQSSLAPVALLLTRDLMWEEAP